ncbi:protein-glutamate methylesterase/protein-glutamine glutaminase [Oceanobacillus rekensis]|uniref:protein-glutamate methylesterase/protein-glutamine glutaminase n=1 Tax=Oceanobacillus rekensis TaxID=937927 RepID=UPI000B43E7CD|nr:chemotaxis response regulator protein-glutamate methylesterase [Oceanobacillus rekensis]
MKPIRVLVIDDSAFMRKTITDILNNDPRMEVISTARNGEEGIKKIIQLSPDVVTLDVHMPIMDGMDVLREIMQKHPVPVVMLSSMKKEGNTKTIEAISNGAVEFIAKPTGPISLDIQTIANEIRFKVYTTSQAKTKKNLTGSSPTDQKLILFDGKRFDKTIVAIGTSTGGPRALQQVLTNLPVTFIAPILIVQHMPSGFTKSLAERLNKLSLIHVKEAIHGEIIKQGTVYIAPGDYHMTVKRIGTTLAIHLSKDAPIKGHRPAVNVLFDSIVKLKQMNKIAVVLTGMGNDGMDGVINIKNKDSNSIIIAENEVTSIVYGMPKSAVKTGLVDYHIPLNEVSSLLVKLTKTRL